MLPLVIIMFLWPATILAQTNTQSDSLYQINQKVCDRFEGDMVKLAAIMEELRRRKGVTETRVAFGGVDTQIKSADYQVTFAAEALAFQRAQKFSSKSVLKANLLGLQSKILRTKSEVRKALNETE
ncbi:MAG: hypothetical protein UT77_C0006G0068 [Candidatus Daviesbacteria bacterium GW2011_GWC2_40_12]|uniref:Outer membrane efflux protein n=1 Tax=Candidatus Daviesbacteria bacterium GW2011_GWC2_40_12 TaxID=1618431 RepID=A0A0G0QWT1_9BACT|nr:MAG: hypothetical protein UT45_C0005G0100 [Candidatus Daviesbacteria bacterium GW2011_GWA2_39_33]KKR41836.1 MAG: hypothetical protein UT77_C0006G0068 [Candidatus Daviesbacteria bacterium GW2011_GWC2_40_12]OGE28927.1 MAG: hypothetical protein A3C29_06160 [Candidatus Daviesbacteria bacterium RIFCSPHIGHO2_02_FULL_40_16]OGE42259.1 MAG: hypothetical protein A3A53_00445 [Candidatus Daviesbacteria bacterium RIFCSPLOWO2_01_FULL_39_23]